MLFYSFIEVNVIFSFKCMIGSLRIPDSFRWILIPCYFVVH